MTDELQHQIQGLGTLLQLQRQAREAESVAALGFVVVNDTRLLLEYRQAALFDADGRVITVSGLPAVERNAPYVVWLERAVQAVAPNDGRRPLRAADLSGALAAQWADWLPAEALLLPLGEGTLLLARDAPWGEAEEALLDELAGAYAHAWRGLAGAGPWWRGRLHPLRWYAAAALVALLALPVRLSVLAPAEVVARDPILVRTPLEGVIERVAVRPNQPVAEGDALFELDDTTLTNRLAVARKALQVAEAEYRQSAQQAVFDEKSKVELAIRKGRMEEKAAERDYLETLLGRVVVRAPRAGVVVFNAASDWEGRAVALGEGVMTLADPARVELEIRLPVADALPLQPGTEARLFLNIAPGQPLPATLEYAAYRAQPAADGTLAYRLKASLDDAGEPPRLGLTGTAKLYGERVSLFYYLMRRPLAAARQWLGW